MRALLIAALVLLLFVARVSSRPLIGVGTSNGLPVARLLEDVDVDTPTLHPVAPETDPLFSRDSIETIRTASQLLAFLHADVPGYPSAFQSEAHLGIPKVIHVSWKNNSLPKCAKAYLATWRAHHPSWRIALWTDGLMRDFVKSEFPDWLGRYDGFPNPVNRADLWRYVAMFAIGGVYLDLDFESLRPMDELLTGNGNSCLVGQEPFVHSLVLTSDAKHPGDEKQKQKHSRMACNAWLASRPGERFWLAVLREIQQRMENGPVTPWNPPSVTGPVMLTAVLERTGFDSSQGGCGVVDPPRALYPAMDKSQLELAKTNCEKWGFGFGGTSPVELELECPVTVLRVGNIGVFGDGRDTKIGNGRTSGDGLGTEFVTLGPPKETPTVKSVCCELAREGWRNPSRDSVTKTGAFAVHHWVHTWLDGPDARVSNAWR